MNSAPPAASAALVASRPTLENASHGVGIDEVHCLPVPGGTEPSLSVIRTTPSTLGS